MPSTGRTWLRVTIAADPSAAEAVAAACLDLGAPGVEEREGAVVAYFALAAGAGHPAAGDPEAGTGDGAAAAAAQVLASLEQRLAPVRAAFGAAAVGRPQGDTVDEEDWAEGWKRYWRPQAVGRRLVIVPSWLRHARWAAGGRVPLWIDPGMAFGTGDHESTRLALVLLQESLDRLAAAGPRPLRVLDLGTGSGILAVAAARLAPASVWACDQDPMAVEVAAANAAANGVDGAVTTAVADLLAPRAGEAGPGADLPGPADLILANILFPVLDAAAPRIAAALRPGGLLVLSGITTSQREPLAVRYEDLGCRRVASVSRGGWSALLMRREPPAGRVAP